MERGRAQPDETAEPQRAQESVIRELYAEYGPSLLKYAMRLCNGDRHAAEDIVQETLLRAWAKPLVLDTRSPSKWLFTVAHNIATDRHRKLHARPPESGPDGLDSVPVSDDTDRFLQALTIAEALAAISTDHRNVLIELHYRGRSVAEAAAALGIPPGTVKSRTYYALQALRLALQERGLAP